MANEAAGKNQQPESKRPLKSSNERPSSKAFLKTHDEGQIRQPTAQRAAAPTIATAIPSAVAVIKPLPPPAPPPRPILREISELARSEERPEQAALPAQLARSGDRPERGGLDVGQAIQQRRGQGSPLPEEIQAKLETGLQAPLGDVRLHTDGTADELSRAVQAKAFTTGSDIFFRQGQYSPGSQNGLHLLAHEGAHVVQQRQGPVSGTPTANGVAVSEPGDPFEREAESAADLAIQRIAEQTPDQAAPMRKITAVAPSAPAVIQREGGEQEILDLEWVIPQTNDRAALLADCRSLSSNMLLKKELAEQVVYAIVTDKLYFYTGSASSPSDSFKIKKGGVTFGAGYYVDKPGATYWKALAEHKGNLGFHQFSYGANTDRHQMANWLAEGEYARIQAKLGEVAAIGIFMAIGPGGKGEGGDGDEETAAPPVPNWLIQLRKGVESLISQEREKEPKPQDLPHRLTVWYGRKNSQWYMNVFVHFDTAGQDKRHKSLPMRQGEKAEELLVRVRTAVVEMLKQEKEKSQSKAAAALPAWAKQLKTELEAKLATQRKAELQATDFPDRLGLTEIKTEGEKPTNEIHLQIWVDITRDNKTETVGGTAGWPLRQGTKAETLARPVRQMAAALRSGKAQQGQQSAPVEEKPKEAGASQTANLPAYPAAVEPLDFRADLISVPGGENSARMKLNYAAVHGSRNIDVVPAMMQTVYYSWQIYDVSKAVTSGEKEEKAANEAAGVGQTGPENWSARRERLKQDAESGSLAKGAPLSQQNDIVQEKQLKLPKQPGDYLIQANATPKPYGDSQRATSRAYLPVRLVWGSVLAMEQVDAIPNQLASLRQRLKDPDLSSAEKQRLQDQIDSLESEEKKLLPEISQGKLDDVKRMIVQLNELEKILKAEKDTGGSAQKDPLAMRLKPELLQLWLMVQSTGQAIPKLREQFERQKIQLEQLLKRAALFSDRLKPGARQFRPIVTLISKVTGQSYPMLMMLGEAPDSSPQKRKYNLIDITSSQTQKVYSGSSGKQGDDGHNEAIKEAFRIFGQENQYGEGKIAVRIPQRYGFGFQPQIPKLFESAPGPLEIAIKWLGYAAAAAGIVALILGTVATGGALGVAATALGTFSAVVGAGLAVHSMAERQASHRLKLDAETLLDVVSIIGSVAAVAGAAKTIGQAGRLGKRPPWIQRFEMVDKALYIHGVTELGTTVILTSAKVVADIERIQNDPELTPEQKERMIAQIVVDAVKDGGMMAMSAYQLKKQPNPFAHSEYKSMVDKGWIDPKTNQWTDAAPPSMREAAQKGQSGGGEQQQQQQSGGEQQQQQQSGDATADANKNKSQSDADANNKKPQDDPNAQKNQADLDASPEELAKKMKQQREAEQGEQQQQPQQQPEPELPVGGIGGVGQKPAGGPQPQPATAQQTARKRIEDGKDFKKLRQEVSKETNPEAAAALLQQQRETIISETQAAISPALEKKHGVTLEYQNLGTPGFQSDMDITAVAICAKRKALREQGVPEADIPKQLSQKEIQQEIAASVEASNQMYQELRQKGLDPDKALDANFYTELRVNDLMGHATTAEKQRIIFHDQDIVALAELRRGMPPKKWEEFKKERLSSLKETSEEFSGKNVLGDAKQKFQEAEKLDTEVRQASLEDLQKQLAQKLEAGASIPEIREAMARVKLKEADAYGSHAAFSDVVGSQQKGAANKREMEKLRQKLESGEAVSNAEAQQLALSEAGMDAFMARAGGEKPGSPEHLYYLSQSAASSAGKLHEHSKASGNSDKDVRDAAKYLTRVQYAGHEAQVPSDGMIAGRDLVAIIGAKSSGNPGEATMRALENWARNAGHAGLIDKPAALRDKFVSEARRASTEMSHELNMFATSERLVAETYRTEKPTADAKKPTNQPDQPAGSGGEGKEKPKKGPIPDQEPQTLLEQLALDAARSGQGREIIDKELGDLPRLVANYGAGEWIKMEYVHYRQVKQEPQVTKKGKYIEGKAEEQALVNVHWFRNKTTGQNVEFKFKGADPQRVLNPMD